jgi:hypothetical protein
MSMGGVVAGIVAAEEPGIRAVCLWSPAAVAPFEVGGGYLKGRDVAPIAYACRYLDHYRGNARLEVVPGADHAWSTVPHRTRLHQSTLEFLREHLHP